MSNHIQHSYYRELTGTVPVTTRCQRRCRWLLRRWRSVVSIASVTLVVLKLMCEIGVEIVIWFSTLPPPDLPVERDDTPPLIVHPAPTHTPAVCGISRTELLVKPRGEVGQVPATEPLPVEQPVVTSNDLEATADTLIEVQTQLHNDLARLHKELGELMLKKDVDRLELLHLHLATGPWLDQMPDWLRSKGYVIPQHISVSIRVSRQRWDVFQELMARFGRE